MTKKDFIKFAKMFRQLKIDQSWKEKPDSLYRIIDRLIDILNEDNPKFDREKFLNAIKTGKGI